MPGRILYNNEIHQLDGGENALSCLLRAGCAIPHSCRAGICHSCLMKMEEGDIPEDAQYGLSENLRRQDFFLACQCYPAGDIKVRLCVPESGFFYNNGNNGCQLILTGAGRGISQLYNFARTALLQGHTGSVRLYHIVPEVGDFYLVKELEGLAGNYPNFSYTSCLVGEDIAAKIVEGLGENKNGILAYLSGAPEITEPLREKIFLAGVSPTNIYIDY